MRGSKNLASYLKQARESRGFTQAEIAKALRYSTPQFISNWERGVSAPPLDKLKCIAMLYHINSKELISVLVEDYKWRIESALQ